MPANVAYSERLQRYQAFYADKPAWHNLGTVVAGARTPEEAVELAGTGYFVDLARDFALIDGEYVEDEESRKTYRTDTKQILGTVGTDYKPIQNITPMKMLGQIVQTREAGIVAHAALGKGERLFAVLDLARLKDVTIPTDPSKHFGFLVAQWWHDGSGALSIGPYMVRVECQNMANAQLAWAERQGLLIRIAHVGDVEAGLEQARQVLGYAERTVDVWLDFMKTLADTPVPAPEKRWMGEFLERLIPIPADMDRPLSREQAREAIASLYESSSTLVGVPHSAYRVVQAVNEFADHYRSVRTSDWDAVPERRFRQITDGPAAELKARALTLVREEFELATAGVRL